MTHSEADPSPGQSAAFCGGPITDPIYAPAPTRGGGALLVHYQSDSGGRQNWLAVRSQNDTTAIRSAHSGIATEASQRLHPSALRRACPECTSDFLARSQVWTTPPHQIRSEPEKCFISETTQAESQTAGP